MTTTEPVADEEEARAAMYGGWAFLAVLFAIFMAVAAWAFNADDDAIGTAAPTTAEVDGDSDGAPSDLTPTALVYLVDGETVTLTGAVPDTESQDRLVSLAEDRYDTVVDELTVDDSVTLTGGTISVVGDAEEGDVDPEGLQIDAAAVFGLVAGDRDVTFATPDVPAVAASAEIMTDAVALSGAFPDEASRDQFTVAAQNVFGANNVDASGLTVDENTTLVGSTVTVTGIVDAGDTSANDFESALEEFFATTEVDSSALSFDTSPEALARLEERLKAELAATPILFDSGSFDVDFADNAAILEDAAAAINAAPDIAVEVVGHTDSSGNAGLNQVLSEDRARAVMERLIELGVDAERLSFRGAGADEPIADNDTPEGRAENRRIVFEFDGA